MSMFMYARCIFLAINCGSNKVRLGTLSESSELLTLVNTSSSTQPLILIADDDRTLQMMLKVAMEQEGFAVVQSGDGEQCLQDYHRLQPDMVLIDAMMPGIDGFECCQKIRQMDTSSQVPILMITVLDTPEFVDRAFQCGASDYITKPISWAVLSHRVQNLLERSQSARQAEITTASLSHYQAWKKEQRQLRQNRQNPNSTDRLLTTLQSLCQFVESDRTLLYQIDSKQWLEASAQATESSLPGLSHLPNNWIAAIQSQFPNPLMVGNRLHSGLEGACQELQESLTAPSMWMHPVVKDSELKAVLLVCFSDAEHHLLALEIESIQDTADHLAYALPSLCLVT